ncbi:hypothetical protein EVAR_74204_1 [Eumeta japonica]|uniref:Uncharacterized protein n=1 Tax=Eumeta variegata TaxID=151549 RepID=A0A4C1SF38_EUMVA|nr:hypothetical protein EVAR_74204_1 [Eumeta japonica]
MCVMERSARVALEFHADHIGGTLKKGQILSTRNRRASMKRLMDRVRVAVGLSCGYAFATTVIGSPLTRTGPRGVSVESLNPKQNIVEMGRANGLYRKAVSEFKVERGAPSKARTGTEIENGPGSKQCRIGSKVKSVVASEIKNTSATEMKTETRLGSRASFFHT